MFACVPCLIGRNRIVIVRLFTVYPTAQLDGYHLWTCPECTGHGERLDRR